MADTTYLHAALVHSSPVPMVVGGEITMEKQLER